MKRLSLSAGILGLGIVLAASMWTPSADAQSVAPNSRVTTLRRGTEVSAGVRRAQSDPFSEALIAPTNQPTHQTVAFIDAVRQAPTENIRLTAATSNREPRVAQDSRRLRTSQAPPATLPEPIADGTIVLDGFEGEFLPTGEFDVAAGFETGCDGCAQGCDSCNSCNTCWSENLTIFGGVHGFKGPLDEGQNGNFGFHEGINLGAPLLDCYGIGMQVGYQATHSNFDGTYIDGNYDDDTRTQQFFTAGVFHRAAPCCPVQWGVAWDFLKDDYRGSTSELSQIRAEISRHGCCFGTEFGFMGAFRLEDDEVAMGSVPALDIESQELYALFVRRNLEGCGEGRLWVGATDDSDGIVGADVFIPASSSWALDMGFQYLVADGDSDFNAQQEETWSLSMNVVYHIGSSAQGSVGNKYRPLFRVADNSSFLTRLP